MTEGVSLPPRGFLPPLPSPPSASPSPRPPSVSPTSCVLSPRSPPPPPFTSATSAVSAAVRACRTVDVYGFTSSHGGGGEEVGGRPAPCAHYYQEPSCPPWRGNLFHDEGASVEALRRWNRTSGGSYAFAHLSRES